MSTLNVSGCLFLDDFGSLIKILGNSVFNPSFNITPFISQEGKTCFACAAVSAYINAINRIPGKGREIPDFKECLDKTLSKHPVKSGGSCYKSVRLLEDNYKFGVKVEKLNNENQPSVRDVLTMSHILTFSTSKIGWDNVKAGSLFEKPDGEKTESSHSVLIQGYNFREKCLICKNSWEHAAKRFNVKLNALHEFRIIRVFTDADLRKEKDSLFLSNHFVMELDGQKIHAVFVDKNTATYSPNYVCEESSFFKDMYIGYDFDEFVLIKSGNPNPIEIGAEEIVVKKFGDLESEAKKSKRKTERKIAKAEEAKREAEETKKEAEKKIEKVERKIAKTERKIEETKKEAEKKIEKAERKIEKAKKMKKEAEKKAEKAEKKAEVAERKAEEAERKAKEAVIEAEKRIEVVVKEAEEKAAKAEESMKQMLEESFKRMEKRMEERMEDQQAAFEERYSAAEKESARRCAELEDKVQQYQMENQILASEVEILKEEKLEKRGCLRLFSAKKPPTKPAHSYIIFDRFKEDGE